MRVGTRVFAEGPYGAFTALHQTRPNTLLVAGGVGITPVRALLEELRGHVVVIYRVTRPEDAVLLHEMRGLAHARGAVLHVVTGPSRTSPLGPDAIGRAVPDVWDRDVFVCGPPGMTNAVLRTMRDLGVPKRQVHAERSARPVEGDVVGRVTDLLSLTVVAPTLTVADATATAAFAMGIAGIEWAAAQEGCEVFAVNAEHGVHRTAGLPVTA